MACLESLEVKHEKILALISSKQMINVFFYFFLLGHLFAALVPALPLSLIFCHFSASSLNFKHQ